jgi:hypothetical protein
MNAGVDLAATGVDYLQKCLHLLLGTAFADGDQCTTSQLPAYLLVLSSPQAGPCGTPSLEILELYGQSSGKAG